jgi:hypothetical protein
MFEDGAPYKPSPRAGQTCIDRSINIVAQTLKRASNQLFKSCLCDLESCIVSREKRSKTSTAAFDHTAISSIPIFHKSDLDVEVIVPSGHPIALICINQEQIRRASDRSDNCVTYATFRLHEGVNQYALVATWAHQFGCSKHYMGKRTNRESNIEQGQADEGVLVGVVDGRRLWLLSISMRICARK